MNFEATYMNQEFPLDTDALTWAALLGRWVSFARSSVALPSTGDGGKLRASVSDLIGLQAVWFALQHLDDLPRDEQRLGIDRAEVLIEKHEAALNKQWGDAMPGQITELIADARQQLAAARADVTPPPPDTPV